MSWLVSKVSQGARKGYREPINGKESTGFRQPHKYPAIDLTYLAQADGGGISVLQKSFQVHALQRIFSPVPETCKCVPVNSI